MKMNEQEFDDLLKSKIAETEELPLKEISIIVDNAWNSIQQEFPFNKRRTYYQKYAVAATVSLLIGIFLILIINNSTEEKVSFRTEVPVLEGSPIDQTNGLEKEALKEIDLECIVKKEICDSEEFQELKYQLAELDLKSQEIEKELSLFGPSPMIIKARIRVENIKTDIIKELLRLQSNG